MAVMSGASRQEAWAEYMRQVSNDGETITVSKPELRAALDAADQWASDNAAAFNSALPAAARTKLTTSQKARLLAFIVTKRYATGT